MSFLDILILYSLGFIILGVVLLVLPRQNTDSRFIALLPFLTLFGLIHGSVEFSTLLVFEHHISRGFLDWAIAVLLFVSFVPLLEFGRRMNGTDASATPVYSVKSTTLLYTILVLAVLSLSTFADNALLGFIIATRFFLGFPATLLTASVFWKEYQIARGNHPSLYGFYLVAALAFLIYGIATIVMPGSDLNLPHIFITEEQFLSLFGIPVQALRAICAVSMAAAIVNIVRNINYEGVLRELRHIREIEHMNEIKQANEALASEVKRRQAVEQQLRVLSMAFEVQEAIMITDVEGIILKVNQAFTRDTGYTAQEVLGQTPRLLKSGLHQEDFYRAMWQGIDETGTWQGEIWDRRKNGELFPMWITISAVKDDRGVVTNYVWSHIDITERKRVEERISFMAYHDRLTALPNRELFYDRLSQAMSQAKRRHDHFALLFLDLDGFKSINDDYGHDVGDMVLRTTANRMADCVRDVDTVARLGGDEFAIILGEIKSPEDIVFVANKLIATLAEPVVLQDGSECSVGVSIGIAFYPEDGAEIDRLMSAADTAMYESKLAGKGTYTFSKGESENSNERPWVVLDESCLLGVGEMDHQHLELVNLLNELNLAVNRNESAEKVNGLFDKFIDKARLHFETEDSLMDEYGYRDERHKQEHQHLIDEVGVLREKFSHSGELAVLSTLKEWLLGHVHYSDKLFADFLKKQRK